MNYTIVGTGSTGNALILNDAILVDCGVPMKALQPYVDKLKLVLLTHKHGDHFRKSTVRQLSRKRPAVRWACCDWMVDDLLVLGVNRRLIDVIEPGKAVSYDGLAAIMPQETMHDAPNCCWHIFTADGIGIFYATDTGHLDGIKANGYDMYFVEANHKTAEIERRVAEKEAEGKFSYEYRAATFHLSEEQAFEWILENADVTKLLTANAIDTVGKDCVWYKEVGVLWVKMHQHSERRPDDGEEVLLAQTEG